MDTLLVWFIVICFVYDSIWFCILLWWRSIFAWLQVNNFHFFQEKVRKIQTFLQKGICHQSWSWNEEGLWSNCPGHVSFILNRLSLFVFITICFRCCIMLFRCRLICWFEISLPLWCWACWLICVISMCCSKREVNKKVLKVPSIEQKVTWLSFELRGKLRSFLCILICVLHTHYLNEDYWFDNLVIGYRNCYLSLWEFSFSWL